MSASPWQQRPSSPAGPSVARRAHDASDAMPSFIGRDLANDLDPRRSGTLVPLLVLVLITALGIAALRIDLIRTRYALAQATQTETALIEEQRALIARKRQLRDPVGLAIQARERGFRPATRVFSLADPVVGSSLPAVAAGPPAVENSTAESPAKSETTAAASPAP